MSNKQYPLDPSTKNTPLKLEEVDTFILFGEKYFKDPRSIEHLLNRIQATIKENRRRIIELQSDYDKLKNANKVQGHPMQKALDSLKQLTPEEKKQLLDRNYLDELEKLKSKEEIAERTRVAAVSETNRMRLSFSKMLKDPEVPQDVRDKIQAILDINKI